MAKEAQKIRISLSQKRFGKVTTLVQGIDPTAINVKELLKKLKSKLACGGTYKHNEIELQGDHRERVRQILIKEGFPPEIIEVIK
jgi:translation initiation factor 1